MIMIHDKAYGCVTFGLMTKELYLTYQSIPTDAVISLGMCPANERRHYKVFAWAYLDRSLQMYSASIFDGVLMYQFKCDPIECLCGS